MALPKRRVPQGDQDRSAGAPGTESDWRAHYEIVDPGAVDAYVRRHPFLMPLLANAPHHIAEHFGTHQGLVLEAPVFPDDGTQHLYLRVRTAEPLEQAMMRRDHLDTAWWIDAMLEACARMTVDVEFV